LDEGVRASLESYVKRWTAKTERMADTSSDRGAQIQGDRRRIWNARAREVMPGLPNSSGLVPRETFRARAEEKFTARAARPYATRD
jgi:hypothetical protein